MKRLQTLLGAGGFALATVLSTTSAYADYRNLNSFDEGVFAFGDVDNDGLTDVVVAMGPTVTYFRNTGSTFEYKQFVYKMDKKLYQKNKKKVYIHLTPNKKGGLSLIIISPLGIGVYKNYKDGFKQLREFKFLEPEWIEDEQPPLKNLVSR